MRKNHSKLKITTKQKAYSISDSPFYKLSNKKKLAELLFVKASEFKNLASDENYKVFKQLNSKGKSRQIEQPLLNLDRVHTRIASLLCRIDLPNYLHSGRKGRSHVSNAKAHVGNKKVLTTDITNFFPSTTEKQIFSLFYNIFKMTPDVARVFAKICCYKQHVPTGSRLSMVLAFWANYKMFEELNSFSLSRNVRMTVYVDDLTFSGENINREFSSLTRKIIKKHGHLAHKGKTHQKQSHEVKVITGVVVKGNDIKPKLSQFKELHNDIQAWKLVRDTGLPLSSLRDRISGRLYSMGQINKRFKDKAKSVRNY